MKESGSLSSCFCLVKSTRSHLTWIKWRNFLWLWRLNFLYYCITIFMIKIQLIKVNLNICPHNMFIFSLFIPTASQCLILHFRHCFCSVLCLTSIYPSLSSMFYCYLPIPSTSCWSTHGNIPLLHTHTCWCWGRLFWIGGGRWAKGWWMWFF